MNIDPTGDAKDQVLPGVIHRYPAKLLILTTDDCYANCPFCFRRNSPVLSDLTTNWQNQAHLNALATYIQNHPQINEIIFSGGEPLLVSEQVWSNFYHTLVPLPQLKIFRWHTRLPIINPDALNSDLIKSLARFNSDKKHQLVVVFHLNLPSEITPAFLQIAEQLKQHNFILKAQGVLLKGLNDNAETLFNLWKLEIENGIIPYYLHQIDRADNALPYEVDKNLGVQIVAAAKAKLQQTFPGSPFVSELKYVQDLGAQGLGKVEIK